MSEAADVIALRHLRAFASVPRKVTELYAKRSLAIRAAFAAGVPVNRIATTLGVPRSVVYRAIEAGTESHPPKWEGD